MKLVRFLKQGQRKVAFGFLEKDYVYAFEDLLYLVDKKYNELLTSPEAYLSNLPKSFEIALYIKEKSTEENGEKVDKVKLLAPLEKVTGLFDFGLTPRHLINSAKTMFKYELGRVVGGIVSLFVSRKIWKRSKEPNYSYYKGNHQVISGPYDDIIWPLYTSYLDVEPELAFVTGTKEQPIGGYFIFNDISARDVQFPEMIGTGPSRSKDFTGSNTIGPYLVTPDELTNPLNLNVRVEISDRVVWSGSTSEYISTPTEVLDFLSNVFTPLTGTVIGMGTIPGCTGMDNDQWILPGETVRIIFDILGELKQRVLPPLGKLLPSRWGKRSEINKCL